MSPSIDFNTKQWFQQPSTPFICELNNHAILKVSGEQSQHLLQGQLTSNLQQLKPSQATQSCLCDAKGRIQGLFLLYMHADNEYWLIMPQSIVAHSQQLLQRYAVFFKVSIEPLTDHQILATNCPLATPIKPSDQFQTFLDEQNGYLTYPQTTLTLIFTRSAKSSRLIEQYQSNDYLLTHALVWHWQLLHQGISTLNSHSLGAFLPHNLNLPQQGAVSFNKGCYTGQEVIARMHYRGKLKSHLWLLKADHVKLSLVSQLHSRQNIILEQKPVGEIVDFEINGQGSLAVLALIQDNATQDRQKNFQLELNSSPILNLADNFI